MSNDARKSLGPTDFTVPLMLVASPSRSLVSPPDETHRAAPDEHGHRVERMLERLPPMLRNAVRWLRKPSSRWARIPSGILFCLGGLLWILPFLGLWMLPLGLLLLAEDVPTLGRVRARLLLSIEQRHPHWFAAP